MPKYKPTDEDMYETNLCFICGAPVLDEFAITCSPRCAAFLKDYEDDTHYGLLRDLMDEES